MDATFRALADPTRRKLIELLRDGPRTTGDLCGAFTLSRFAVMKHLRVLGQGGLVIARREGRRRWNSLNIGQLHLAASRWNDPAAAPSDATAAEFGGTVTIVEHREPAPPADAPDTTQVFVDAVPWRVFDALTVNIAGWWGAPYLRSADATNLVLEAQPGGRFFEEWGHRQGALRATVAAIRQDERLEFVGPIFARAADTRLAFALEAREGGTLLTVSAWNAPAGAVNDLFRDRLKAFVERGVQSGLAR
jgi:DNA-binding transcriptional ArsR family regulator